MSALTLKLQLGNDIRRLTVPTLSFSDLVGLIQKLFQDALPKSWVVKYRDSENDLVTITSELELQEALSFAKTSFLLKLIIVEREVPSKAANASKNESSADPKFASLLEGVFKNIAETNPFILQLVENWIDTLTKQSEGETPSPSPHPHPRCGRRSHCNPNSNNNNSTSTSTSSESEVVHNATCDNCQERIAGIRYKCTTCDDYDLCSKCLELRTKVHPEHKFYVIEKPFGFFGGRPCGRMFGRGPVHAAVCDACESRIVGIRYKCQDCPNYDLCSQCIQGKDGIHPDHKFNEIKFGFGRCPRRWQCARQESAEPQQNSASTQAQAPAPTPSPIEKDEVETAAKTGEQPNVIPTLSPVSQVTSSPVEVPPASPEPTTSSVNVNSPRADNGETEDKVDVNSSLFADIHAVDYKLKQLQEMGFSDRDRNIALLVKNRGNVVNTVKDLLDN